MRLLVSVVSFKSFLRLYWKLLVLSENFISCIILPIRFSNVFEKNKLKITIDANQKVTNFLDVTLDLQSGKFRPYKKPGNVTQYVHTKSNHPPAVIKAIPKGINKRLNEISSDEQSFNSAAPEYQAALEKSGHCFKLKYEATTDNNNPSKRRNRPRKITWFNPPFDLSVENNIGKEFLIAINECFPVGHVLRKICNRNTLKLSYSCMPNIKNKIDSHNKRKLSDSAIEPGKPCNCRNKDNCPLNGECREKNIIYQATVAAENNRTETYIGLTSTEFKTRYNNHNSSFRESKNRYQTELSKHIWKLKDSNINYQIKWKIIGKAKPYCNTTKRCNLCLLEKYYIICHKDKASLNQKSELISCCRHKSKFLLKSI